MKLSRVWIYGASLVLVALSSVSACGTDDRPHLGVGGEGGGGAGGLSGGGAGGEDG